MMYKEHYVWRMRATPIFTFHPATPLVAAYRLAHRLGLVLAYNHRSGRVFACRAKQN